MNKLFNAIIRLRRDNDYNYAKIKDTFVPAKGEPCLVDTAKNGLRVVIGDGFNTFGDLPYVDGAIVRGYLKDNIFYNEAEFITEIPSSEIKLFFNILDSKFYYFYNDAYNQISANYVHANDSTAGIMKLYSTTGFNEDGTMTQKAITQELSEKIEVALDIEEELLIFQND